MTVPFAAVMVCASSSVRIWPASALASFAVSTENGIPSVLSSGVVSAAVSAGVV